MTSIQEKTEAVAPRQSKLLSPPAVGRPKIAFFGVFGVQNLGNECTLQAILHSARELLPGGQFYSICYQPDDTSQRHNLAAVSVQRGDFGEAVQRRGGFSRLLRICFRRIPDELLNWLRAIRILRGTDLMIMTGTGMLTDYNGSAFSFPHDILLWAAAARLAGCKVRFVGVGVGPIYSRLSRYLIRNALALADYRSFRDEFSKNRIRKTGFNSDKDPVFPDLAFSLPPSIFPQRLGRTRQKPLVGLGVMEHRDLHIGRPEEQDAAYSAYLEKMCDFVSWLIDHGYAIRILQGDSKHDPHVRSDLKGRLERRGVRYDQAGIIDEDCATVEELLPQLAEADFIVSPRFHNLLLGLMLNIPAISISYDPKNDALLESVGLGKYCQPITALDVKKLIDQFTDLEEHATEIKTIIRKVAAENRRRLEEEYDVVFGNL